MCLDALRWPWPCWQRYAHRYWMTGGFPHHCKKTNVKSGQRSFLRGVAEQTHPNLLQLTIKKSFGVQNSDVHNPCSVQPIRMSFFSQATSSSCSPPSITLNFLSIHTFSHSEIPRLHQVII